MSGETYCKDCKYYVELEHNFKQGIGYEESHACTVLARDGLVVEVSPMEMCEVFTEKED